MPLFDFRCGKCHVTEEHYVSSFDNTVDCPSCGDAMEKLFSGSFRIKEKYPLWVDRFDDYQKRQEERGVRPTVPHPKDIL